MTDAEIAQLVLVVFLILAAPALLLLVFAGLVGVAWELRRPAAKAIVFFLLLPWRLWRYLRAGAA